jgi:hypothetical protein
MGNGANYGTAFVAGDFRVVTPDTREQTTATVRCAEIRMREECARHCDSMLCLLRPYKTQNVR